MLSEQLMVGALALERIIIIELLQLWSSTVHFFRLSLKSLKLEPGNTQNSSQKSVPAQDQTRRQLAYSAFITTYRNPRNPPAEQGRARTNYSNDAKESTKKYILGSCNLVHPVTHIHNLRIIRRQSIHLSSKSTTPG